MNQQWTPRSRDALLGKVRRTTVATGAAAAVIVGGLAYGLSAASTTLPSRTMALNWL